ncbi:hypothetical protein [Rhizobium phaseoli]|uniref:hypothetical protein n=1 Tax=Rhizobium phaseoli TaxID=396 RepID=UPI001483731B|nr:hypothetical protein [Rhizobium phaseoli]
MDAFVIDDGELYILFERSFDGQPPHYRTLPTIRQRQPDTGLLFRHANHPTGMFRPENCVAGLVCGNRSDGSLMRRFPRGSPPTGVIIAAAVAIVMARASLSSNSLKWPLTIAER